MHPDSNLMYRDITHNCIPDYSAHYIHRSSYRQSQHCYQPFVDASWTKVSHECPTLPSHHNLLPRFTSPINIHPREMFIYSYMFILWRLIVSISSTKQRFAFRSNLLNILLDMIYGEVFITLTRKSHCIDIWPTETFRVQFVEDDNSPHWINGDYNDKIASLKSQ